MGKFKEVISKGWEWLLSPPLEVSVLADALVSVLIVILLIDMVV